MQKLRARAARVFPRFWAALCFGLVTACLAAQQAAADDKLKRADFERARASREAKHVADWVVHSGDSRSMPFAIVDKKDATVFVFDAHGRLLGAAPALLGLGIGDNSIPGIGDRKMSTIRPKDRTTPAGRFVAELSHDAHGVDILLVDYELNVAIHRVITTNPKERRLHRLATPTPLDNRISFGCINVPVKFYENVVRTAFTGTKGIVYVLPETKPAHAVFASYDLDEHTRLLAANRSDPQPSPQSVIPVATDPRPSLQSVIPVATSPQPSPESAAPPATSPQPSAESVTPVAIK
jgi:hypothetical protein